MEYALKAFGTMLTDGKKLLKKIVLDQETCIEDSCFLARRSEPLHACPQLSDFKAFQLQ